MYEQFTRWIHSCAFWNVNMHLCKAITDAQNDDKSLSPVSSTQKKIEPILNVIYTVREIDLKWYQIRNISHKHRLPIFMSNHKLYNVSVDLLYFAQLLTLLQLFLQSIVLVVKPNIPTPIVLSTSIHDVHQYLDFVCHSFRVVECSTLCP